MKLIVAVVRPERLEAVKEALADIEVFRLTVGDVQGLVRAARSEPPGGAPGAGPQAVLPAGASPAPGEVRLERRARLEIAVNEGFLEPTLRAIVRAAHVEGEPGGSIFVLPLTDVVRIRTGERGPEAI